MDSFNILLPVLGSVSFFSFLINKGLNKFYLFKKKIDVINHRSSHNSIATKTGGLSILILFVAYTFIFYLADQPLYNFKLLMPLSLISILGYYDDQKEIDYKLKLVAQILIAKILIDQGFLINNLNGFLGFEQLPNLFSQFLTMLIFLTIINSFNFIDGIDGLAISVFSISIIFLTFISFSSNKLTALNLFFLSSIIPLFYFNFKKKNKTFLGDSGSLFLGSIIGINVISIISTKIFVSIPFNRIILSVSLIIYPIVDLIRVVIKRILSNKSPFLPDNNHLHHLINKYYNNHRKSTFLIILCNVVFLLLIIFLESKNLSYLSYVVIFIIIFLALIIDKIESKKSS